MKTVKNSKKQVRATAIGTFYMVATEYVEKYKIGGFQKLQKIIGEELVYKKGKIWWWNNPTIITLPISKLNKLIDMIRNS